MNKIWAFAFLGCLAVASCSKNDGDKESTVMLQEPVMEMSDSTTMMKPADATAVNVDSVNIKIDSAR